jgi:aspartyl-tRNA(Asn)/glutamyl-tRNA(Gln) amidotransferase subunit B
MTAAGGWEMVCGLEVHCELRTRTKLFCSCPNEFGSEPNTNVCPVCLGLPGSLPVLNRHAVELAMRIGAALHCEVRPSIFARKNYFYPDMPKDYQISQYDQPINVDGFLDLPDGTRVGVERAHMEEDTGKSTHGGGTGRISDSTYSLVDYNRSGVPLVEIVSRPDIRSSEQARLYAAELRGILVATGASDGKMEEGSMRVDANVSVRRPGEPFGTRCEIKNLNSLRSLGRAIEFEAARQIDLLEAGERIRQETRHWDEGAGRTRTGRVKEEADDYRYFPEPDLVPLQPDAEWVASVRAALPVLPAERRVALAEATGLEPAAEVVVTAVERGLDSFVLDAVGAGAEARTALNRAVHDLPVGATAGVKPFAALVGLEVGGALTATQAKKVLEVLVERGGETDPATIAAELGFEALAADALASVVDGVVAAHPADWEAYVGGNDKVAGMFVGKVMKATKGKADGKAVTDLLQQRRAAAD